MKKLNLIMCAVFLVCAAGQVGAATYLDTANNVTYFYGGYAWDDGIGEYVSDARNDFMAAVAAFYTEDENFDAMIFDGGVSPGSPVSLGVGGELYDFQAQETNTSDAHMQTWSTYFDPGGYIGNGSTGEDDEALLYISMQDPDEGYGSASIGSFFSFDPAINAFAVDITTNAADTSLLITTNLTDSAVLDPPPTVDHSSEFIFGSEGSAQANELTYNTPMFFGVLDTTWFIHSIDFAFTGASAVAFDSAVLGGPVGSVVPEPASLTMLSLGLIGLAARRRKNKKQS